MRERIAFKRLILGNYNLLFGADAVLGQLRKPTIKQLLDMKELGLFL